MITSFLDGAQIAYDKAALKADFINNDVDGNGKLGLEEFIEAYKRGSISDIFCIPTRDRQKIPHHADVRQLVYSQTTLRAHRRVHSLKASSLINKLLTQRQG